MFSMFRRQLKIVDEPDNAVGKHDAVTGVSKYSLEDGTETDTSVSWNTSSCSATSTLRSPDASFSMRNGTSDGLKASPGGVFAGSWEEPCYSAETTLDAEDCDHLVGNVGLKLSKPLGRGLSLLRASDMKVIPMFSVPVAAATHTNIPEADASRKSVITLPALSSSALGKSLDVDNFESPKTSRLHARSCSDDQLSAAAMRIQNLRSGSGRSNMKYLFEDESAGSDEELARTYESTLGDSSLEGAASASVHRGPSGQQEPKRAKFEQSLLMSEEDENVDLAGGLVGSDIFVPIDANQASADISDEDSEICSLFS